MANQQDPRKIIDSVNVIVDIAANRIGGPSDLFLFTSLDDDHRHLSTSLSDYIASHEALARTDSMLDLASEMITGSTARNRHDSSAVAEALIFIRDELQGANMSDYYAAFTRGLVPENLVQSWLTRGLLMNPRIRDSVMIGYPSLEQEVRENWQGGWEG
jgi:hypothetical protein